MNFWDFLSSWPLWFQIILSSMTILLLFFIVREGLEISKGKIKLRIGKKINNLCRRFPHKNCHNARDIMLIINELDFLKMEKWHIENIDQIRIQMNYAEQKTEEAKSVLQQTYLNALIEKNVVQAASSKSYLAYQIILHVLMYRILEKLRISFLENHFYEMTEKDFTLYLNDKVSFLLGYGSSIFNELYFIYDDLTREEFYKKNQSAFPKFAEIVIDVYRNARKVSLENKSKIIEIDSKINIILNDNI